MIKYKYTSQLIILSKLSDCGSLGCEKRCLWVPPRVMLVGGCDLRVEGELAHIHICGPGVLYTRLETTSGLWREAQQTL